MDLDFISAKRHKRVFEVRGYFYDMQLQDEIVSSRSVLEIVRQHYPLPRESTTALPDAIVIMMNPGSSRPRMGKPEQLQLHQIPLSAPRMVATRPDNTQYQIMRIMHFCHWNMVRVLNLSDVREASSAAFMVRFDELEKQLSYTQHSLFEESRSSELARYMERRVSAPVIAAWGMDKKLNTLIRQCTTALAAHCAHVGLVSRQDTGRFLHPLQLTQRDKELWVYRMVAMLSQHGG